MRVLNPQGWPRPKGYANGIAAKGETIFLAGIVGWNEQGQFPNGLVAQFRQVLANICAILAEGGAQPHHLVRMTWYVTSRADYLANAAEIGRIYREQFGRHYPAMAVVEVVSLMEPDAVVEIEATAVVPD